MPKEKQTLKNPLSLIPIKRAAVIAVPDLDAPGNKAKTWKAPMNNAPIIVSSIKWFLMKMHIYMLLVVASKKKIHICNIFNIISI